MDATVKFACRIFSVNQSTCDFTGERNVELAPSIHVRSIPGAQDTQISGLPHLSLGVAEDDCLRHCEGVIQVTERVKLPLLALNSHEELLDALKVSKKDHACQSLLNY